MKALWNNLFVPALVIGLGFSAVNVHAADHISNANAHSNNQHAGHQSSSSAKTSSAKTSSAANASSSKSGMSTSKEQTAKHDAPVAGKGDQGTTAKTSKTSDSMKTDNASAGNKATTSTKKDSTGSTKGASNSAGSKKDSASTGSKSTSSTSNKESPWGTGGIRRIRTGAATAALQAPLTAKARLIPRPKHRMATKAAVPARRNPPGVTRLARVANRPRPAQTAILSVPTKWILSQGHAVEAGGSWTQEQCAPKWTGCAKYNKWASCPNEWHVKFYDTYCLPTNYCYWQKKYFDARCGCYTYYDSYSSGWYYYEPVVKCYIPVTYCEQYQEERTVSLEESDVCEVEVPVCETVRNYRLMPVKPVCQPYIYARLGR